MIKPIERYLERQKATLVQIGRRLKELGLKAGNTDAEKFAYRAGINWEQYRLYELGANMYLSNLIKLTKALGISLNVFFKEGIELAD